MNDEDYGGHGSRGKIDVSFGNLGLYAGCCGLFAPLAAREASVYARRAVELCGESCRYEFTCHGQRRLWSAKRGRADPPTMAEGQWALGGYVVVDNHNWYAIL